MAEGFVLHEGTKLMRRAKWSGDRQYTWERVQGSDHKDEQIIQEKNGCTEWKVSILTES